MAQFPLKEDVLAFKKNLFVAVDVDVVVDRADAVVTVDVVVDGVVEDVDGVVADDHAAIDAAVVLGVVVVD